MRNGNKSQSLKESSRLASYAVFRELYDKEKDIYGVIACFLEDVIVRESKYSFTLEEISLLLNKSFSFSIPDAIVKTSLKRLKLLSRSHDGDYIANLSGIEGSAIGPKQDKISKDHVLIIQKLLTFIKNQQRKDISEIEKGKIIQSFCSFLIDKSSNLDYADYVSAFIVSHQGDVDFIEQLNCIKEGVVLYTGITFNDDISNIGSWNTKLTIFLETEMLFNFAGYNGDVHQTLFNELISFVREINLKASKSLIKFRYFTQSANEVAWFFKKAEDIIEGKSPLDPTKTAMKAIVNGCSSRSDILEKRVDFFNLLRMNDIIEDDYADYFNDANHKYNIIDQSVSNVISSSIGVADISDTLDLLNYVSIRRGLSNGSNFENVRYILLSGKILTTERIVWHEAIYKNKCVPLATSLDFLIGKFWFKLNKGFGENVFPRTFDVITKAQILLSAQLSESVSKKFEEFRKKLNEGLLTETQIAEALVELRSQVKKPEEINKDDLSFVLSSISETRISQMIQARELFKREASKSKEENIELKDKVMEQASIIEQQRSYSEESESKSIAKTLVLKEELLSEKRKTASILESRKLRIDKKVENYIFLWFVFFPIITFIAYISVLLCIIKYYEWNDVEPLVFFAFHVIFVSLYFLGFLLPERKFDVASWLRSKKEKLKVLKYASYDSDLNLYRLSLVSIQEIENDIRELRSIQQHYLG